ncbi:MAG: HAD-IIA family hydrolase [Chloroflexi bacterium]|nr:MAG: HAD-IIA family hydrolase [Chloroflexota bacterium]
MNTGISANIKGIILDMDGVLWRADQPLLDMPAFFHEVKTLGIPVVFATNNGTRSVAQYVERLAGFGVPVEPWQVVNSAIATADYLSKQFPQGGPLFVVAETGVIEALAEKGFYLAPKGEDPLAVVAGMDRAMSYDKLAKACLLIRAGKPFIGTNPDLTFPTPYGLVPGAGATLAYLEAATGVPPFMIGKPEPYLYQFSIERLGTRPEETLAVGDRLETDILGGQRLGSPTVLVLSGVTTAEEAEKWQPQPSLVLPNLADLLPILVENVSRSNHRK